MEMDSETAKVRTISSEYHVLPVDGDLLNIESAANARVPPGMRPVIIQRRSCI